MSTKLNKLLSELKLADETEDKCKGNDNVIHNMAVLISHISKCYC